VDGDGGTPKAGPVLTVRATAVLVRLPHVLVITQSYEPESEVAAVGTEYVAEVAPPADTTTPAYTGTAGAYGPEDLEKDACLISVYPAENGSGE